MIDTVGQKTRADTVVDQLLEEIRSGQFAPGARLASEIALAARFQVGRTTVREALKVLVTMGVVTRSRGGTFVHAVPDGLVAETLRIAVTEQSVHSLYEARRVLEVAMATLAAERASERDLKLMREAIGRLAAAPPDDWKAVLEADMGFHARVAEAARNEVLAQVFALVRAQLMKRLPSVPEIPAVIQRSVAHHWEVYQAIADREPHRAGQVMAQNLSTTEGLLIRLLKPLAAANEDGRPQ